MNQCTHGEGGVGEGLVEVLTNYAKTIYRGTIDG
jgi:hypothetical protein